MSSELERYTYRIHNQDELASEIRSLLRMVKELEAENLRYRTALQNIAAETGTPYARIANAALYPPLEQEAKSPESL
jgi:hypothetical protein